MKQVRGCNFVWGLALLGALPQGHAAELGSEAAYLQDLPVVLTASRLSQHISDAPNAMSVIDRETIEASGFNNVADIFKLVPGMYVSYYSGNQAIVSYHGTTDQYARRMQVMIDGRTVYLPLFGQVDWEDLPLQIHDIERIEVVRGPAAASYGANSTQGVINIITREAGELRGLKGYATTGARNSKSASMHWGRSGENLDFRMTAGYRSSDGFDPNRYGIQNDSYATRLFNLRANYRQGLDNTYDIQFGYNGGVRGDGWIDSILNTPHDRLTSSDFQQVGWQHILSAESDVRLRYYHIGQNVNDATFNQPHPLTNMQALPVLADRRTQRHDLELQHTLQATDSNRLVWGIGARQDSVDAPNLLAKTERTFEHRLFMHDEWRVTPEWVLNTGAMAERNAYGQSRVSPRASLNWHFMPGHTLRAGLSQAYRNPALIEQRGDWRNQFGPVLVQQFFATGRVKPERMLSREIGYLGEFDATRMTVDARVFHDQLNDIIYVRTVGFPASITGSTLEAANLFNATHSGFETTVKYQWESGSHLLLNYAYHVISSTQVDYANGMPMNSVSAQYLQRVFDHGSVAVNMYQQSTMLAMDRGPIDRQPFTRRVDLRLANTFKSEHNTNAELALVIQNLFNHRHTEYVVNNVMRRGGYLTLSLSY